MQKSKELGREINFPSDREGNPQREFWHRPGHKPEFISEQEAMIAAAQYEVTAAELQVILNTRVCKLEEKPMARTLHIEDLVTKISEYQRDIRLAIKPHTPLHHIRTDIERAQEKFKNFLEDEHGIYLDYTPRE